MYRPRQGPIMNPRQVDNEQIFHFTNSLVWPERGCPVFLHGLVSASHLNNKVGEVGKFYNNKSLVPAHGVRFAVHFEDNTKLLQFGHTIYVKCLICLE